MGKSDEPRRLYQQVADQIRASVQSMGLRKGARLPSERDLAQELGVSRPSLREALIALEIEGTVEIRGGSGIYLAAEGRGREATQTLGESPSELMQARSLVEGSAIVLAAGRMTDEALLALKAALDDMESAVQAGRDPLGEDTDMAVPGLVKCSSGTVIATAAVAPTRSAWRLGAVTLAKPKSRIFT